jgi:hypothetical protein
VIFRATPQWFVSMQQNGLRDAVNREILKVDWIPDWGKKRIELMVGNRYKSATSDNSSLCFKTAKCETPESNHTSSVSVVLS